MRLVYLLLARSAPWLPPRRGRPPRSSRPRPSRGSAQSAAAAGAVHAAPEPRIASNPGKHACRFVFMPHAGAFRLNSIRCAPFCCTGLPFTTLGLNFQRSTACTAAASNNPLGFESSTLRAAHRAVGVHQDLELHPAGDAAARRIARVLRRDALQRDDVAVEHAARAGRPPIGPDERPAAHARHSRSTLGMANASRALRCTLPVSMRIFDGGGGGCGGGGGGLRRCIVSTCESRRSRTKSMVGRVSTLSTPTGRVTVMTVCISVNRPNATHRASRSDQCRDRGLERAAVS